MSFLSEVFSSSIQFGYYRLFSFELPHWIEAHLKMQVDDWEGQQQENEPEAQHQAPDDEEEEEDILDMEDDDQGTDERLSLLMRFCPNDSTTNH